jgi:hypothetical protein
MAMRSWGTPERSEGNKKGLIYFLYKKLWFLVRTTPIVTFSQRQHAANEDDLGDAYPTKPRSRAEDIAKGQPRSLDLAGPIYLASKIR